MITSNEPWNTETHKRDRNPSITHHKPWPFEPVRVKFCFLRGSLRWLTAVKNAIVSWLLNFRIRMFVKRAVIKYYKNFISLFITMNLYQFQCLFVFFFGTYTHKLPSNPYISCSHLWEPFCKHPAPVTDTILRVSCDYKSFHWTQT